MAREIPVTYILDWLQKDPVHIQEFDDDVDFEPVFQYLDFLKVKIAVSACPGGFLRSPKINHELDRRGKSPKKFATYGLSFADVIENSQKFINAGLGALVAIYDPTDSYQDRELVNLLEQLRQGESGRLPVGVIEILE